MTSEPTPRPWRIVPGVGVARPKCDAIIVGPEPEQDFVANVIDMDDAALIVRAVNRDHLFQEMVALVQEVVDSRNTNTRAMAKASPSWVKDARALLAKVTP